MLAAVQYELVMHALTCSLSRKEMNIIVPHNGMPATGDIILGMMLWRDNCTWDVWGFFKLI
jgi:hypothetical protein